MTNFNNPIYPLNIADMIRVMVNGTTQSLTERLADTPTMTSGRVPNTQIDAIPTWAPSTDYPEGNVVTYDGSIYKCHTTHTSTSTFDITKWDAISSSGTVRAFYQHIAASSSTVSSITLNGDPCLDINNMWVIVEHTVIPQSLYSLSLDGTTLNFNTPVDAGLDIDLRWFGSNQDISPEGANYLMTYNNYTTNRILEIPQDIKLELVDGTLTLKAGSKVYIPNGFEADGTTPKFDVVTIESDKTGLEWFGTNTNDYMIFYEIGVGIDGTLPERCASGTSYPSSPSNGDRCYRTDLNRLYVYRTVSSSWIERLDTLPIAIVKGSGGIHISIDQVFNGFGYIGSTIFALPGVRVQIPNGKNEDGTYNSLMYTVDSVLTNNTFNNATTIGNAVIHPDGLGSSVVLGRNSLKLEFNTETGYMERSDGTLKRCCKIADLSWTTNGINSFTSFTVDSVANSNASNLSQAGRSYLSAMGMPSSKYIDLALGSSGSNYTAPANGYFIFNASSSSASIANISLENKGAPGMMTRSISYSSGAPLRVNITIKKGDKCVVGYSNASSVTFRFFYAEGES